MRRAKHLLFLACMMYAVSLAGQSRGDLREMFVSAEGDLLFEDYAESLTALVAAAGRCNTDIVPYF